MALVGKEIRSVGRSQDFAKADAESAMLETLDWVLIALLGICWAIAFSEAAQVTPDNNTTVTIDFIGKIRLNSI
ncbi:hypothetical protein UH38_01705 [Aliterella atlantica CENA595]|uniref:Uncharacterized protein n=1 Tax=Aliterella atlantica CENA595 TaxID=1618023 RepID=A0A0D8ZXK9_9CYAN|nr:hypothetical protein UH38_01705 [Aliterella atlantica CENA595]